MVIIYEELTKNLHRQPMYDILNFLNSTIDLNRIDCTIRYSQGNNHRKEKCIISKDGLSDYLYWKKVSQPSYTQDGYISIDIFKENHRLAINAAIDRVSDALIKRGHNPLRSSEYKNSTTCLIHYTNDQ